MSGRESCRHRRDELVLEHAADIGVGPVSRFMTWHQRHHQDCKETMTNFFSLAALAKTASFHSPQKPSLLSMGAALPP
jgi:hypothetical protein